VNRQRSKGRCRLCKKRSHWFQPSCPRRAPTLKTAWTIADITYLLTIYQEFVFCIRARRQPNAREGSQRFAIKKQIRKKSGSSDQRKVILLFFQIVPRAGSRRGWAGSPVAPHISARDQVSLVVPRCLGQVTLEGWVAPGLGRAGAGSRMGRFAHIFVPCAFRF
jgi:hypothetical protein